LGELADQPIDLAGAKIRAIKDDLHLDELPSQRVVRAWLSHAGRDGLPGRLGESRNGGKEHKDPKNRAKRSHEGIDSHAPLKKQDGVGL
jgi:hypothetical protein